MLRRDQPVDGLDVLGGRRVDLLGLLARQLDRAVAGRVRRDAGVVEHHRAGAERLADRLAGDPVGVQLRDHVGEVLRRSSSSIRRSPISGSSLSIWMRCWSLVDSATSTREARQRRAACSKVGSAARLAASGRVGQTRSRRARPRSNAARIVASRFVLNEPAVTVASLRGRPAGTRPGSASRRRFARGSGSRR